MKIVVLGLIAVAIVNVAVAAPGDKGRKDDTENETSKVQLNMVLEQMKELRHQLQQQQEQQHLTSEQQRQMSEQQLQMTKLMEKQQEQLKEQQDQLKQQQRLDEELQRRDEEQLEKITKIQRSRRSENKKMRLIKKSENETVEHITKLVLSKITPMIDGLSECAIGNYTFSHTWDWGDDWSHCETATIPFGRTFSRTPKVIASTAGYDRPSRDIGASMDLFVKVHSPTTTKFELEMRTFQIYISEIEYIWIACA